MALKGMEPAPKPQ